ncbi:SART-1 protein [Lipomyces oligophaga]|uniref:SART-1 protein n=1 Tax=Lipomyces oligophaga TaxID=45792 RepID=UPI0034CEC61E
MTEEEISLEETNKRRIELGLKPIPIPSEPESVTRQDSEQNDGSIDGGLSIEDTNRLREKLGLRPIPVDGKTSSSAAAAPDSEEVASANWKSKHDEDLRAAKRVADLAKISQVQEKMKRVRMLQGKGLADGGDEYGDAKTWLKKSKKKFKIGVPAIDQEADSKPVYTSDDLKGLKVGHSLEEFDGQDEVILTLKDSHVLDDEEDELISTSLSEKSRLERNIESRKRKSKYTGYEDDDGKQGILSQYDDIDEDGQENGKDKFFTLDSEVISIGREQEKKQQQLDEQNHGKIRVSLDYDIPDQANSASDYLPAEKITMKKLKKTKRSSESKRRRKVDDDELVVRDYEMPDYKPDLIEHDDDDLQVSLARQRRISQKKRKSAVILTPEMLAHSIKQQNIDTEMKEEEDENTGLILDDMTEFVGTVGNQINEDNEERERIRRLIVKKEDDNEEIHEPDASGDVLMKSDIKIEDGTSEAQQTNYSPSPSQSEEEEEERDSGIGTDVNLSSVGLGSTLSMLRSRGIVPTLGEQDKARQRIERENNRFKASLSRSRALAEVEARKQRELDRKSGKFDTLTQREREDAAQRANQKRQLEEARDEQRRFKDYKPDVKIEYKDEFGRSMSTKEAFKHLSHQFHGKGAGKQKTEKKLKRIAEERKKESKSLFR